MAEIGIEMGQETNWSTVDLFGERHAKKVFKLFGQAYGALPPDDEDLTAEQKEFLDRSIQELRGDDEDGRIAPVRLSLFAQMLSEKEWSPRTLESVDGSRGVGVRFLEGQHEKAVADYTAALWQKPRDCLIRYNRGVAHVRHGSVTRALLDFDTAIGLNPNYAPAYRLRAELFDRSGSLARAAADRRKADQIQQSAAPVACQITAEGFVELSSSQFATDTIGTQRALLASPSRAWLKQQ